MPVCRPYRNRYKESKTKNCLCCAVLITCLYLFCIITHFPARLVGYFGDGKVITTDMITSVVDTFTQKIAKQSSVCILFEEVERIIQCASTLTFCQLCTTKQASLLGRSNLEPINGCSDRSKFGISHCMYIYRRQILFIIIVKVFVPVEHIFLIRLYMYFVENWSTGFFCMLENKIVQFYFNIWMLNIIYVV